MVIDPRQLAFEVPKALQLIISDVTGVDASNKQGPHGTGLPVSVVLPFNIKFPDSVSAENTKLYQASLNALINEIADIGGIVVVPEEGVDLKV